MAKLAVRSYTTNTSLLIGGRLLISRLVACSARIFADRQTHRTTTVTLAAHARRGLITWLVII